MRESKDVSINRKGGYDPFLGKDDIRSFVPYAGKRREVIVRIGNRRRKFLYDLLRTRDQVFGFCLVVVDGTNDFFDVGKFSLGKCLKRRVGFKKDGCNLVHLLVSALSRKHDRDEELILIREVELRVGIRVEVRKG